MRRPLRIARHAERQIRNAFDWWLRHRPASPGLFRQELAQAFELITTQPTAGAVAAVPDLASVRRVLLVRTQYHLYYWLNENEEAV